MSVKTKIVIIEDNEELCEIFVEVINNTEHLEVVSSYNNCEDALKYLKTDLPDIVLMDIDLPGINGIEGTKRVKKLSPKVKVIIITVFENSKTVFDALCAGAIGYLTKNVTSHKLINAIDETISGGAPMSMNIAKMVVQSFQKSPNSILTSRETEVLTMLSKGNSYKSVAIHLEVSPNTIKYHVKNIYDKLQVHNREDAIKKASDNKYI